MTNENLEKRVRRLERANRWWMALCLGLGVVFLLGGASDGAGPGPLRSQRIELVDESGKVRALLGTDEEGSTGLFVNDPKGKLRASLTHDASQSALFLRDDQGTIRVGVAQFAHGGGGVALHGAESKGAAVLYHKETGSLTFYDGEGNTEVRIPPEPEEP